MRLDRMRVLVLVPPLLLTLNPNLVCLSMTCRLFHFTFSFHMMYFALLQIPFFWRR